MPNLDQPKGFEPWGRVLQCNPYEADTTIYKGDLLKLKADGQVEPCAAGTVAAIGVALSYATAGNSVLVADDPNQLFVCQSDDATEPAAITAMNLNYNIVVGTASTLYKRSAMEIDGNTGATDSNLPIKALRLAPDVNNAYGANARVVCVINNHARKSGDVGTLGV
jgi:hypothetical protein